MILNEYWREQSHYLGQSVCRPAMPFIKDSMKLIVRYEKPKAGSSQSGRKQHSNPSLTLVEPIQLQFTLAQMLYQRKHLCKSLNKIFK